MSANLAAVRPDQAVEEVPARTARAHLRSARSILTRRSAAGPAPAPAPLPEEDPAVLRYRHAIKDLIWFARKEGKVQVKYLAETETVEEGRRTFTLSLEVGGVALTVTHQVDDGTGEGR